MNTCDQSIMHGFAAPKNRGDEEVLYTEYIIAKRVSWEGRETNRVQSSVINLLKVQRIRVKLEIAMPCNFGNDTRPESRTCWSASKRTRGVVFLTSGAIFAIPHRFLNAFTLPRAALLVVT